MLGSIAVRAPWRRSRHNAVRESDNPETGGCHHHQRCRCARRSASGTGGGGGGGGGEEAEHAAGAAPREAELPSNRAGAAGWRAHLRQDSKPRAPRRWWCAVRSTSREHPGSLPRSAGSQAFFRLADQDGALAARAELEWQVHGRRERWICGLDSGPNRRHAAGSAARIRDGGHRYRSPGHRRSVGDRSSAKS